MIQKPKPLLVVFALIIVFALCSLFSLPWNEPVRNFLIGLQFKIRGERPLSDDFVFVFIGAEDVKELGGWPITRDYYGYLTHILTTRNAKTIGLYFLLDTPDARYPEYDAQLANFIRSSDRVCLPMAFEELVMGQSDQLLAANHESPAPAILGRRPISPIREFVEPAAAIGFSNLGEQMWHPKAPLWALHEGDPSTGRASAFLHSYGYQLASVYLNGQDRWREGFDVSQLSDALPEVATDARGRLRLNHFGGPEQVNSIGLLDLLQSFELNPDSLDFEDKIVIVDVTAPGVPTLEATPLASALPASLIQATVAENIIHQNFLRTPPQFWELILVVFLMVAAWFVSQMAASHARFMSALGFIAAFWLVAQILFGQANLVVPLFYPTLAFLGTFGAATALRNRARHSEDNVVRELLQEQIKGKEARLKSAQSELAVLQTRFKTEASASEEIRLLAQARRQAILALEKQLADLQAYPMSEPVASAAQFSEIIHANGSPLATVLELVSKVAPDEIPVLLLGETGTGKEMVARAIHSASRRKDAPFVAINCGALPETLLDSELFGHEKGSFTGAQSKRKGRFELANGGTVFLDEITETSPAFQARLLRVLQEKTFERVGGEQSIQVDVRIIAATNKDVQALVDADRFRSDLFYRLNAFPISLPPLRDRSRDTPLLLKHFLKKYKYETINGVSDHAVRLLQSHAWPGNVRELENVIRRAALLAQSAGRDLIQQMDLPEEIATAVESQGVTYQPFEDQILESLRTLQFSRSAISKTAEILGNKDRGTITEYFRGICFREFARADFQLEEAVKTIAGGEDQATLANVRAKISEYLGNLKTLDSDAHSPTNARTASPFKGLPKKFHPYLSRVLQHLQGTSA